MCVFRAGGREFPVRLFMSGSALDAYSVHVRGEPNPLRHKKGGTYMYSGIKVSVSASSQHLLEDQIRDAQRFLTEFSSDLLALKVHPSVEYRRLDFPVQLDLNEAKPKKWIQELQLPASFLKCAGDLGIDIMLSLYPPEAS